MPMIRKHDGQLLFWPDLASCHYLRSVIERYKQYGIKFVPKNINPANMPQPRLLKIFF